MSGSRRLSGFTLVELMVVVAIVLVLVGMLLPALLAAHEAALMSDCQERMRQTTLGIQGYVDAYGAMPKDMCHELTPIGDQICHYRVEGSVHWLYGTRHIQDPVWSDWGFPLCERVDGVASVIVSEWDRVRTRSYGDEIEPFLEEGMSTQIRSCTIPDFQFGIGEHPWVYATGFDLKEAVYGYTTAPLMFQNLFISRHTIADLLPIDVGILGDPPLPADMWGNLARLGRPWSPLGIDHRLRWPSAGAGGWSRKVTVFSGALTGDVTIADITSRDGASNTLMLAHCAGTPQSSFPSPTAWYRKDHEWHQATESSNGHRQYPGYLGRVDAKDTVAVVAPEPVAAGLSQDNVNTLSLGMRSPHRKMPVAFADGSIRCLGFDLSVSQVGALWAFNDGVMVELD